MTLEQSPNLFKPRHGEAVFGWKCVQARCHRHLGNSGKVNRHSLRGFTPQKSQVLERDVTEPTLVKQIGGISV